MVIPSRTECLARMAQVGMPPHIQKHSFTVAEIALYLGCRLNENGIRLNLQLVEAGALLHDIAKPQSLSTGERHEELGARMLRQWGFANLASIVEDHVSMDHTRATGHITESLLVNYSDKRVKHEEIVTLQERFLDLVDRYARTDMHRNLLNQKLGLYLTLERRIFAHLIISPTEAELMDLRLPHYTMGDRSEDYEQEEIDCRIIGRR